MVGKVGSPTMSKCEPKKWELFFSYQRHVLISFSSPSQMFEGKYFKAGWCRLTVWYSIDLQAFHTNPMSSFAAHWSRLLSQVIQRRPRSHLNSQENQKNWSQSHDSHDHHGCRVATAYTPLNRAETNAPSSWRSDWATTDDHNIGLWGQILRRASAIRSLK